MWTFRLPQWHAFSQPASKTHKNTHVCAASKAEVSATTTLSPRQRKLAAKRKQKQEQQVSQPKQLPNGSSSSSSVRSKQKQQQLVAEFADIRPVVSLKSVVNPKLQQQQQDQELPASIISLAGLADQYNQLHQQQQQQRQQQQQQQQQQQDNAHDAFLGQISRTLNDLSAYQLSELAVHWAQESRNMLFCQFESVQPVLTCYVTAAEQQLQLGDFDRHQLADVAWGLAHFDGLEWRWQQQQQGLRSHPQQQQRLSESQQQQQQQASQIPLRWCGTFQSALNVPFLILPNLMPDLDIAEFEQEVTLQRDVIFLQNDKGEVKAVSEARLTGWQSDIGATFKYSGKEMVPESKLTPNVAKVRDVLEAVTGQHYDSVLINYYQDGKCGMRYHVDPLYGKWTPNSAVVSLGDTRQFVFRRIDDHNIRWSYRVSNGDVVVMFDDCQDILQHAVKVEATADAVGPRISLVYKQRMKLDDGTWA